MKTSIPLYHQLKQKLLEDLQSNKWAPGEPIPSETVLAKEHGVSRITVRQAVGDLVSLGYLIRRQGIGTFVAKREFFSAGSRLQGFAEELRLRGHEVFLKVKRIDSLGCPTKVADELKVAPGTAVVRILRVAAIGGCPVFRETSYLILPSNATLEELVKQSEFNGFIYGFLEQHGVKITFGSQRVSATKANYEDTQDLMMPIDEPVLFIRRVTSDETGMPVEFSEVRYPATRYEYFVSLSRGKDNG